MPTTLWICPDIQASPPHAYCRWRYISNHCYIAIKCPAALLINDLCPRRRVDRSDIQAYPSAIRMHIVIANMCELVNMSWKIRVGKYELANMYELAVGLDFCSHTKEKADETKSIKYWFTFGKKPS